MLKYKTARFSILLIIVFSIFSLSNATAQIKWSVLTTNGSWPGLSDPRAIFIPGDTSHVILGYVTEHKNKARTTSVASDGNKNRKYQQPSLCSIARQ